MSSAEIQRRINEVEADKSTLQDCLAALRNSSDDVDQINVKTERLDQDSKEWKGQKKNKFAQKRSEVATTTKKNANKHETNIEAVIERIKELEEELQALYRALAAALAAEAAAASRS